METTDTILALPVRRRVTLNVGQPAHVNLVLAGCGGTGSFLALALARLAWHCHEASLAELHLTFVDPDRVEIKNIGRQNFAPAEVGQFKAEALARRYSLAFGLQIRYFNEKLQAIHMDRSTRYSDHWLHMVAGCVDTTTARRNIAGMCKKWDGRLWWLDCGNHDQAGQVILGNSLAVVGASGTGAEISPLGFCVGLPLPSLRHPELVRNPAKARRRKNNCADDLLAGAQSLMINQLVASWAASYLYRLVVTHDLDVWATYFDLEAGSARSEAIG
jgi:PRTRC genetic system ThiF family protein